MRRSQLLVALSLVALLSYCLWAQTAAPNSLLLVANKGDNSLGIIDPVAGKQVAEVAEGGVTGHEVTTSPDGKLAYVPIYGNSGVGQPGTDGTNLVVIDLAARKVVGNIDFGKGVRPHLPVIGPKNGLLYVSTELNRSISIIDPATLKIVGSIPTGQEQSHMFAITRDGRRAYTANVGPGTVSVLDLDARKTITIIPVSPQIQRISLSVDDRLVFTSDVTKPQLAVIDTATNKIKTWVPLAGLGYGSAPTPDGRWLAYESNESGKEEIYARPYPDINSGRWQVSVGEGRVRRSVILQYLMSGGVSLLLCGSDLRIDFDCNLDQLLNSQRWFSRCRHGRRRNPPNGK